MTVPARRVPSAALRLALLAALLAAGLVAYSQTAAFAWDEGFHLITAQLIKNGKRPYLDFFFPQTPLNAYWNAFWMRLFGDGWRAPHAVAGLLTAGAAWIAGDYVLCRFPDPAWRLPGALLTTMLIGFNIQVVEFGTLGQAYGSCLFLITAAFRTAVIATERRSLWWSALAGVLATGAACSSLLTAPVAPLLLLWMLIGDQAGRRWTKAWIFVLGSSVAMIPVAVLFVQSPWVVFFNIVRFHASFRQLDWSGAIQHDFEVLTAWLESPQALLLFVFAGFGIWGVRRFAAWDRQRCAEMLLAAAIPVALSLHLSNAHPTFERYYLFTVPFLAILTIAGLAALCNRMACRPAVPVFLLGAITGLGLARQLYIDRDSFTWGDMEEIARKVDSVTPPGAALLADEGVYMLLRRTPPSGLEHGDAHKLTQLSTAEAARLHVIPRPELNRRIQAGEFATIETDEDPDDVDLSGLYAEKAEVVSCKVYWKWKGTKK